MGLDLTGLVDDQGAIPEAVLNALEAQNGARGNLGEMTDAQRAPGTLSAQSGAIDLRETCLLYTSPSPRNRTRSRMPSSA